MGEGPYGTLEKREEIIPKIFCIILCAFKYMDYICDLHGGVGVRKAEMSTTTDEPVLFDIWMGTLLFHPDQLVLNSLCCSPDIIFFITINLSPCPQQLNGIRSSGIWRISGRQAWLSGLSIIHCAGE